MLDEEARFETEKRAICFCSHKRVLHSYYIPSWCLNEICRCPEFKEDKDATITITQGAERRAPEETIFVTERREPAKPVAGATDPDKDGGDMRSPGRGDPGTDADGA